MDSVFAANTVLPPRAARVEDRVAVRRTIDAMQLTIRSGNPAAEACDALVVPVAADKRLSGPAAAEHGRLAGGAAVQGLSGMTIGSLVVVLPERADARFVQGLTEGLALASYRFDRYRTPRNPRPPWSRSRCWPPRTATLAPRRRRSTAR